MSKRQPKKRPAPQSDTESIPGPSKSKRRRPKIGIALGGGVARGWAHIGVMRALDRLGVKPDVICGTSVGALVGGAYLAGKLDALETWARSLTRRRMLGYLDFHLGGGGLIGGERLLRLMSENFGDIRVEDLPRPFVAVCTELETGHETWLREGRLVDVISASYALPGVFSPVHLNDTWLIDGALVNPVPISVCRALGARVVLGVTLQGDAFGKSTRNEPYLAAWEEEEKPNLLQMAQSRFRPDQIIMRQVFGSSKDKPGLSGVMLSALNIIMDRLARSRLAGDPADVLISPKLGHIGLLDFDRAEDSIPLGEEAIERQLPELQEALTALG